MDAGSGVGVACLARWYWLATDVVVASWRVGEAAHDRSRVHKLVYARGVAVGVAMRSCGRGGKLRLVVMLVSVFRSLC